MGKTKKKDVAKLFGMLETAPVKAGQAKAQKYYPFIT